MHIQSIQSILSVIKTFLIAKRRLDDLRKPWKIDIVSMHQFLGRLNVGDSCRRFGLWLLGAIVDSYNYAFQVRLPR